MRYSHCERDSGRCHNTQLFCKNLVHSHNVDHAGAVDRVAVVADQLGDGADDAVDGSGDVTLLLILFLVVS